MFSCRGIHPSANKNTASLELQTINDIEKIRVPMRMQIGPGCKACVKKGDFVKVGQLIGEPLAAMSVPIHAGVSGEVLQVKSMRTSDGSEQEYVEINNDGQFTIADGIKPVEVNSKEDLVAAVRAAGLIGLGGAGFPTHIKLSPPPDKKIDRLLVNAMECEPYITSDDYLCRHHAAEILEGVALVMEWCEIPRAVIGLENNTPLAFQLLSEATQDYRDRFTIEIKELPARYPQGAEKVLIRNLTGREVPSAGLPHDVGVLVLNVGTCRYIAHYLHTGMPLVRKYVTIDGSAIKNPGNYDVPIGSLMSEVIEATGGFKSEPGKIIMGGPMMGIAVDGVDNPIIKNNNAILVLDEKEAHVPEEGPCIHCGRCVRACPMYLMPTELDLASRREDLTDLRKFSALDCIECGSCSYICPAKRQLVQNIRVGKRLLQAEMRRQRDLAASKKEGK